MTKGDSFVCELQRIYMWPLRKDVIEINVWPRKDVHVHCSTIENAGYKTPYLKKNHS